MYTFLNVIIYISNTSVTISRAPMPFAGANKRVRQIVSVYIIYIHYDLSSVIVMLPLYFPHIYIYIILCFRSLCSYVFFTFRLLRSIKQPPLPYNPLGWWMLWCNRVTLSFSVLAARFFDFLFFFFFVFIRFIYSLF